MLRSTGLSSALALTAAMLVMAPRASAQDYRWEENTEQAVAYMVYKKLAEIPMRKKNRRAEFIPGHLTKAGAGDVASPGPVIAEPGRGQNLKIRRIRAPIVNGDLNKQVLG